MPKTKQKITKDMSFGEVLQKYPQTVEVFMKYGMHCIGCAVAMYETIEQGAIVHNLNLKKLIADLNKAAKKKK